MPYVYSTISQDNAYAVYDENSNVPRAKRTILIKGGANVADGRIDTPLGIVTEVSQEDLEILLKDCVFQAQMKAGFLRIDKDSIKVEKAIEGLEPQDKAAPLNPADYGGNVKGKTLTTIDLGVLDEDSGTPAVKAPGRAKKSV